MRSSKIPPLRSWLIVVLALLAADADLFWPGRDGSYPFTTLRGETVQMYGKGLYCYASLLIDAGFQCADAIALFLTIPCSTLLRR